MVRGSRWLSVSKGHGQCGVASCPVSQQGRRLLLIRFEDHKSPFKNCCLVSGIRKEIPRLARTARFHRARPSLRPPDLVHAPHVGGEHEEGSLLEYPVLALHGKLPTISYQSVYGPANAWVPAAAMWLFGISVNVERGVGLLYPRCCSGPSTLFSVHAGAERPVL